jgi:hypothetical protein
MEFLDGQWFEALVYSLADGRNRFGICSGADTTSSAPDGSDAESGDRNDKAAPDRIQHLGAFKTASPS